MCPSRPIAPAVIPNANANVPGSGEALPGTFSPAPVRVVVPYGAASASWKAGSAASRCSSVGT
jgi:hypothetical protein